MSSGDDVFSDAGSRGRRGIAEFGALKRTAFLETRERGKALKRADPKALQAAYRLIRSERALEVMILVAAAAEARRKFGAQHDGLKLPTTPAAIASELQRQGAAVFDAEDNPATYASIYQFVRRVRDACYLFGLVDTPSRREADAPEEPDGAKGTNQRDNPFEPTHDLLRLANQLGKSFAGVAAVMLSIEPQTLAEEA